MATCQEIYDFLTQVSNRSVTAHLAETDMAFLGQLGFLRVLNPDEYAQLSQNVSTLAQRQAELQGEAADRAAKAQQYAADERHTHSIFFHFEGTDKRAADLAKAQAEQGALVAEDRDLLERQRAFAELMAGKATLDSASKYNGGYVALTSFGLLQLRDLGLRLYRAADREFSAYWKQTVEIEGELGATGLRSAQFFTPISSSLPSSDRGYLWAIAIGLARQPEEVPAGIAHFLDAYAQVGRLAHNDENRLMSAEILTGVNQPPESTVPALKELESAVAGLGVPSASALGVATILFYGRRQDGTFATPNLEFFLRATPSYEAAALLAIVNLPVDALATTFNAWRSKFGAWGFSRSEDVELASAYLTVSGLALDGLDTKLGIIIRGIAGYLQYPLVASSILASIPIFEANESLNWLEKAYEVIGQRAMPLSQAELICLAVRMVHGIDAATIQELDATPKVIPPPPGLAYMGGPRFFFVPIIVTHSGYYSTFSGLGGAHPGHIHAVGGFSG